jgi:hypothetical protein
VGEEQRLRNRREDEVVPQVGIFSSGELTPFEIFFVRELVADAWLLRGRLQGSLELVAPEDRR